MRFTINLATRLHLDPKLVNRVGYLILAILCAVLAWNVSRAAWSYGEMRRLRGEIASFESKLNSRPGGVSEQEFKRQQADIKFYNEIIGRKAYNWLALLEQVEAVTPEGIALTILTPDKSKGTVSIEGHAKSFANVRSYVEKLEDSKTFTSVLLMSHANIAVGDKGRGVHFSISCKAALQ